MITHIKKVDIEYIIDQTKDCIEEQVLILWPTDVSLDYSAVKLWKTLPSD
jgi:hypothetical protein